MFVGGHTSEIPKSLENTEKLVLTGPAFAALQIESRDWCFVGATYAPCKIQGKKKTHKHKQMCGIVPGLGGWQNCVYVFFVGSLLIHKYPQYSWEFHDRLWEALSGTTSEKRSVPILEMLWKPQMT